MNRYDIQVERASAGADLIFHVTVRDGQGAMRHEVTLSCRACERLTGGRHTPEDCVHAAFHFLLEREPMEAILSRFDMNVIERYFPDFDAELPRYLSREAPDR